MAIWLTARNANVIFCFIQQTSLNSFGLWTAAWWKELGMTHSSSLSHSEYFRWCTVYNSSFLLCWYVQEGRSMRCHKLLNKCLPSLWPKFPIIALLKSATLKTTVAATKLKPLQAKESCYTTALLWPKDSAFYCYCAYVLCVPSVTTHAFLRTVPTNSKVSLRGL